ncbi:MAG: alpha/beta hydrolase fold domain-containing protein [Salaquimonas sp.]
MATDVTDILEQHPARRLARLESEKIAKKFVSEVSRTKRIADSLLSGLENRLIERILVGRLRRGIKAAEDGILAQNTLSEMRGAYESGAMETLPSFLPSPSNINYATYTESGKDWRSKRTNRPVILYTAGGGFMFPLSKKQKHMIQRMAEATGCEIVSGTHRLAPENPYPAAIEDIADQYEALVESGVDHRQLFLGGDTAGASVTMGALQNILERGSPLPAGIILFAPWCDLGMTGWSYITGSVTNHSPFRMETAAFCARIYLAESSPFDPKVSAVYGNASNWPPILIHTSKYDLHFDDAIKLAEMGESQGCDIRLNYWDSPRHHLERMSSKDALRSFEEVTKFINRLVSYN